MKIRVRVPPVRVENHTVAIIRRYGESLRLSVSNSTLAETAVDLSGRVQLSCAKQPAGSMMVNIGDYRSRVKVCEIGKEQSHWVSHGAFSLVTAFQGVVLKDVR